MKKRIIVIIALIIGIGFLALKCWPESKTDDNHAVVIAKLSNGTEKKAFSENGIDVYEKAFRNKMKIHLEKGESVRITFICDECDDEQEEYVEESKNLLFKCNCPDRKKECAAVEIKME